ncbi:hypothetical protein B0H66DRAFT_161096 [Apodospora peruviana]|uniref:Lpxtg-domain-containing protein n=1 Tax=Apodospora peruviana TaxID=516989 RepID=A0AAE0MCB1_9PEZI|nr:hypothetical protein B0H66DRAFT_161096 [Apodospora peruviana]
MYGTKLCLAMAFAPLVSALRVSPNSPCSSKCGNTLSSTTGDDMACKASEYSRGAGTVFESCVGCEATSSYVSKNESDVHWLLHNIRYNIGYCLWGELGGSTGTNPCITSTACGPLHDAVSYNNYTTSGGAYDYCDAWSHHENFVPKCQACLVQLREEENSAIDGYYIDNYLIMLDAACQQKPKPGTLLSVQGDPFATTPVVITTPSPTYASVPTPDYGPVSLGARVGIAFGGLAFLLTIVGFCIVCNGKRRRRAFLRDLERRHADQGWPHPKTRYGSAGDGDMFETPVSQRPLRSWDESPVSAGTTPGGMDRNLPLPRYFSPYSSNYNSPVSATDGGPSSATNANWPTLTPQRLDQIFQEQSPAHGSPPPAFTQWPSPTQEKLMQMHHEKRQTEIAIGLALGGDDPSLRSKNSNSSLGPYGSNGYPVDKKGKERDEAYEMVESPYNSSTANSGGGDSTAGRYQMPAEPEAPVLHHPGYGRHHGSRPGTGGTNGSAGVARMLHRTGSGLTEDDMRRGNVL